MKKFLPLLFLPALFFLPQSAHAGLSEMCNPSVECNAGEDYYAGNCQKHVETVQADCLAPSPGQFSAFSCNYGCYFRTTPESTPCAAGVMANGKCMTTTYLVDDQNVDKIWDGANLTTIGAGNGSELWKTDNDIDVYRPSGKVGIGTNAPLYNLDVAGDLNLNKNQTGAALYASSRQMLWYNPDPALNFAAWGNDAKSNFFGKPVGIGMINPATSARLSILNDTPLNAFAEVLGIDVKTTNDQNGATYGTTNNVTSNGTGTTYGGNNIAFKTQSGTTYGTYSFAQHSGPNNVNKAYGLYGSAYNSSTNCVGPNCAEGIGVYGTSGNTLYGTGGYFEGGNVALHAVGKSSTLSTVGLLVQNNDLGSPSAVFECTGSCTSGIFKDGDDASAAVLNSGIVIIGEPGFSHLAFDTNSIMAKASGVATAPLYLNENGGGVAFGTTFPTYKITLDNVASNLGGRGIANAWNTYSDSRVKLNQKQLSYGLSDLMKLQPKSYDHYSGNIENGKIELGKDYDSTIGLIAQEVYKVIPEAVEKPKDENNNLWALDYDKLIPVLIQSVQDLKKENDAEISDLKRDNEALKKLVCLDHPEAELCKK